jgi:hypothetical protein
VLYECLTVEPLYSGAHAVALLTKILFDEAPRARDKLPKLTQAIERLVNHALGEHVPTKTLECSRKTARRGSRRTTAYS